ncbi:hypothetical protein ESY86_01825 [Subsaximicrobium wynnwilliamsii]|uniref:DUF4157 domain-containing protein n=2 Tax=Subsaximicrobium wynnwilliamsii TaxID=291179 RepID=A0A5C6ZNY2_9FLAO|nr:hypothetical protein ESY87_00135 [Subsaximicrobium wynnwilliamsii]TXD90726.1 hypothetical protein ESY86_01825 [Subsaximicrobium wynnwilliamsii]TXE05464.1 hypothetical protein ESY88_00135 [Subsaximicrobium wynnwilliamsii]
MKVVVSKSMLPKGYLGITLCPFIVLKYKYLKSDAVFMNHERIHLQQQLELLILPFFIIYVMEFFLRLLFLRNWSQAYRSISFEKEAYANDGNLDYLKSRPFWRFIKFI